MARNSFRYMDDAEQQEIEATGGLNNPSLNDEAFLQRYNANVNTPQRTPRTAASFRSETVSTHRGNAVNTALAEVRRRAPSEVRPQQSVGIQNNNRGRSKGRGRGRVQNSSQRRNYYTLPEAASEETVNYYAEPAQNKKPEPVQNKKSDYSEPSQQSQTSNSSDVTNDQYYADWTTGFTNATRHSLKQQIRKREDTRLADAGFKSQQEAEDYKHEGSFIDDDGNVDWGKVNKFNASVNSIDEGKRGEAQLKHVASVGGATGAAAATMALAGSSAGRTAGKAVVQGSKAVAQGARTAASKVGQAAKTVGNKAKQLYDSAVRANNAARGIPESVNPSTSTGTPHLPNFGGSNTRSAADAFKEQLSRQQAGLRSKAEQGLARPATKRAIQNTRYQRKFDSPSFEEPFTPEPTPTEYINVRPTSSPKPKPKSKVGSNRNSKKSLKWLEQATQSWRE